MSVQVLLLMRTLNCHFDWSGRAATLARNKGIHLKSMSRAIEAALLVRRARDEAGILTMVGNAHHLDEEDMQGLRGRPAS